MDNTELSDKYEEAKDQIASQSHYIKQLLSQRDELVELIHDAGSQIEYLHDKFSETGTGNNVISRIKSLLTKITTKP